MDIGRAFGFVFDDPEWVKKILIGGAISIIPLIGTLVVYGYMIEIARRTYHAPEIDRLPEWDDFGGYLSRGFFFWLGLMLWALPFILLVVCGALAIVLLGATGGGETAIGVSLLLIYLLIYLLILPAVFIFALVAALAVPLLLGRFAVRGRIGAMFEVGEIVASIRQAGAGPVALLLLTYLAAGYIGQMGIFLCLIGVIFTGFYGNLAVANAAGQVTRQALDGSTPGSGSAPVAP